MNESRKKTEIRIPARSISLLVTIKQRLMEDNDLSSKVSDLGKYAVAHHIDDLIINVLELERRYHELMDQFAYTKRENDEYSELLDGYSADILGDEEKAEVRALVEKWKAKEDESDDGT